jgi:hypothetical protein
MKNAILALVAFVGAVSAFAESKSSAVVTKSANGSVQAVVTSTEAIRGALSTASTSADASSRASFSEGRADNGLNIIGAGISDSAVTLVYGLADGVSQSGETLKVSTSESASLAGDTVSASANAVGEFSKANIYPISVAFYQSGANSVNALVDGSKSAVKLAVDASGNVYTWSRDNVVQPVWGLSVQFSTLTWQSATQSVQVVVSGESAKSVSGAVSNSATTVWEVLVSAAGEVQISARDFSAAPSQSIGQLLDDASEAVKFVISNPGQILTSGSEALVMSFDAASTSGRNLASAARNDASNIAVSLDTYSAGVSAVSLSRTDKRGKNGKRLATAWLTNPATETHSRLFDR